MKSQSSPVVERIPHRRRPAASSCRSCPPMAPRKPPPIRWSNPITPSQVHSLILAEPNPQKALELFNSAAASNLPPSLPTLSLLIYRLSAANLLPLAHSLLSHLPPSPSPDDSLFLPLLRAHGRNHDPLSALRLFRQMKDNFQVSPSHRSFTALLAVLVADNQLKLAFQIHKEMVAARIPLTVASFNVLIKALCQNAKTLYSAVNLFGKMPGRNCPPDSCTYGTLIDGLCKHGRINEAKDLFKSMEEKGVLPTVVTFTTLINGLSKGGCLDEAVKMFDEMGKRGIKPNVVTFSALIDGLCKGGESLKGMGLLERMVKERCLPNTITYSAVINGLCGEGRVKEAAAVLDRMRLQGRKPDAGLFGKIVEGFCEAGRFGEAANYLDEMVLSGIVPNRVTWSLHVRMNNMVARGLCGKGDLARGFQVYMGMRTRGINTEVDTYHVLVDCYCKKGDVHKAARIVDEMLTEGCVPERDTWVILMGGYWSRRKVREAAEAVWGELLLGENVGS